MSDKTLPELFFIFSSKNKFKPCMADSLGRELSCFKSLVGTILLSRALKNVLGFQRNIGIMVPPSVGGGLANTAISTLGKTPVNLNFTAGEEAIALAISQAGIDTIITSKRFLDKFPVSLPEVQLVYLEEIFSDLQKHPFRKISVLLQVLFSSGKSLWQKFGTPALRGEDLATIIFTSGTTGKPKGAMLTHNNIVSNIEAVTQLYPYKTDDVILGALPFFHCFGFTDTLWLPLVRGGKVVFHANPTEAKTIGKLVQKHKVTFMMSTPTFCQMYVRGCHKESFVSLRHVLVGAEKLREKIDKAFKVKFDITLLEGYGCTETGPVIAVNVPSEGKSRWGAVGKPIPNVEIKVLDIESLEPVATNQEGLLFVRSPGVMKGYLGVETEKLDAEGWYNTGDIAKIDSDGFIFLTDRLDRFSKLGGEMVPHLKIEDEVNQFLGEVSSLVVAIPDDKKGEVLGILYSQEGITSSEIHESLMKSHLPKLWIPKKNHIFYVEELPLLASGKPDLVKAKAYLREKVKA